MVSSLDVEISDDPASRLRFALDTYRFGPETRRYEPYGQAVVAFMRWQNARGVLNPVDGHDAGSPWWRAVNADLLRDTYQARHLFQNGGAASRPAVEHWVRFFEAPSTNTWYLAHNASVVAGYLDHIDLAQAESEVERFLMNVTLLRVLYAHALLVDAKLALGRLSFLGRLFRKPMMKAPEVFLAMRDVLPQEYPVDIASAEHLAKAESRLGKLLDHGVIGARLDALYALSAKTLDEPRLLDLVKDGVPAYAWPPARRHAWRTQVGPVLSALVGFFTRPTPHRYRTA